jgi:rSAM/selenodomain-associated transferase 1
MRKTRIVIFAKAPVPGKVKTRLIPALGEAGAAKLAFTMLNDTVAEALAARLPTLPELCADPHPMEPEWAPFLPQAQLRFTAQGEGDLGERMARAAKRTLQLDENILLVGADCPELDRVRLRAAAVALRDHDAVIHPTRDGGYALLGLRRFDPSLFSGIAWSTPAVAAETVARIRALGWSLHVAETLRDIDEPTDLL